MRYVTTRDHEKTFDPTDALTMHRGPEGGFFVPKEMPSWKTSDIHSFINNSFSDSVAFVINTLFDTKLDSWAIDFAIGRHPVKISDIGKNILIAEAWNNPSWRFTRLASGIEKAILQSDHVNIRPSDWLMIAARISVLCGIYGEFVRGGILKNGSAFDISFSAGDFSGPMAAWYARSWGLPIGKILCCCNDNDAIWNFLCKGEIRTGDIAVSTNTPESDNNVPGDLERLIDAVCGSDEAIRFCECCRRGLPYRIDNFSKLSEGIFTPVISTTRIEAILHRQYKSNRYIVDPYTALAIGGIADYRSKIGESKVTIVFSETGPILSLEYLVKLFDEDKAALLSKINAIGE